MNAKEVVLATLKEMPDTATLAEILDELELQLAVDESIQEIESGHYYTQQEIEDHFLRGFPLPESSKVRQYPPPHRTSDRKPSET
jgi:hypothetical protein